ncbi:MAG: AbrB/MazE/SpoVT family DNA-binding domain-containing protein [Deltaproteobacteria bacterium]|nr:AbrB/MazE/SpoVT family DNA-binding domain-containing protein [Deltaproteobacteria bacterium]
MSQVKVLRNGQITLPKETRQSLSLKEGDLLDVEVRQHKIIITLKRVEDKESELTEYGREEVAKGIKDYLEGRGKLFDNVEDLITDLTS